MSNQRIAELAQKEKLIKLQDVMACIKSEEARLQGEKVNTLTDLPLRPPPVSACVCLPRTLALCMAMMCDVCVAMQGSKASALASMGKQASQLEASIKGIRSEMEKVAVAGAYFVRAPCSVRAAHRSVVVFFPAGANAAGNPEDAAGGDGESA